MDLRNLEVAVNESANASRFGPSGTRKRQESSCFLCVGGSKGFYNVTINFEKGHACINPAATGKDKRCQGNAWGKGQKYGPENQRDTGNSNEWCRHISAALADIEKITEAQEISAQAYSPRPVFHPVEKTPEPIAPERNLSPASQRLADIEAERVTLLAQVEAENFTELRDAVEALVEKFGYEKVGTALRKVA